MRAQKRSPFLGIISIGLAVVSILFGPWGMTGRAQAAPDMILVTFAGTDPIQYTDLGGIPLGEGLLAGELRCVGENCSQKIEFTPLTGPTTDSLVYEYKFKSRLAYDPGAGIVFVSGTGTLSGTDPKIRFAFTGTLRNNGDGTIRLRYDASTAEASFIFPAAPGTFSVLSSN